MQAPPARPMALEGRATGRLVAEAGARFPLALEGVAVAEAALD